MNQGLYTRIGQGKGFILYPDRDFAKDDINKEAIERWIKEKSSGPRSRYSLEQLLAIKEILEKY